MEMVWLCGLSQESWDKREEEPIANARMCCRFSFSAADRRPGEVREHHPSLNCYSLSSICCGCEDRLRMPSPLTLSLFFFSVKSSSSSSFIGDFEALTSAQDLPQTSSLILTTHILYGSIFFYPGLCTSVLANPEAIKTHMIQACDENRSYVSLQRFWYSSKIATSLSLRDGNKVSGGLTSAKEEQFSNISASLPIVRDLKHLNPMDI
ncbi:hypothetical protein DY000_02017135 [Brassica cretica]|uniref:Uncharacterized protein n=1 Tax=Brassica cretica TaxID=69181 RepID=A0ABQ7DB58_BRACR|nr:hypothetical protein DY000_02017135 [Brassica cretica]